MCVLGEGGGGRGSENTNRGTKGNTEGMNLKKHQQNILGKIQVTLCEFRRATIDEDSEDANMPLVNRESRLKAIECRPRAKRKICHQARKKCKKMDKVPITSAFNTLQPLS